VLLFFKTLQQRNKALFYFGLASVLSALVCLVLMVVTTTQVLGISAWIKPFKFFLSSAIFAFTMGWIMFYLEEKSKVLIYSWVVIIVLAFETIYIAYQAATGQLSHFNISSAFTGMMFSLMGIAITIMTLWTAYIGYLFFIKTLPGLPGAYIWGIRLGILFFVLFAFEGGFMAARLSHTVGAADGGAGIPVINWSTKYGDLRVAHFFGMHSLQVIPLFSWYIARNVKTTFLMAAIYFMLTSLLFMQALYGKPLLAM
jgi:hypothetical protein